MNLFERDELLELYRLEEKLILEEGRRQTFPAAKEKMEAALFRKRERLLAARREQEKKEVTAGPGWRVLRHPAVPHEMLEHLARNLLGLAFHGVPLLTHWRFRWADLAGVSGTTPVVGLCVHGEKLILIDQALTLGGASALARKMLIGTLAHEIVHALLPPGEAHGDRFKQTLKSVNDVVLADDASPVASAPVAVSRNVPKGMYAGRPVPWPDAHEWEFR